MLSPLILLSMLLALAGANPAQLPHIQHLTLKSLEQVPVEIQPLIIDGYDVQGVDNVPYLVSLSLTKATYTHLCGGCIIAKRWILTAAHCVDELRKFNDGDVLGTPIYAGIVNRSNVTAAQVRYVDFASTHRGFNGAAGSDNIALLHVSESFEYSARVQAIALPDIEDDYSGKTAAVYGWGLTDADADEYSKELKYAFAPLLNSTACKELLPTDAPLTKQQVCSQVKTCYGDGGTPLIHWPITGPAELVGLGSWSYMPCGFASRPTVYTSVPAYVGWIYQVIGAYYQLN
ncbi:chymotrypsinogen A [Drosophila serrata]|uniref:chymotrypsinogen A n=1 Tax=Drosophila serrata TaxID=7274 RepID=UPI000A1D0EBE|nr:chymotrypsinogen A [Drosophila serrata]